MNIEQLTGRCCRLKQELLTEYCAPTRNSGRIARLSAELASTEREIAAAILDAPHDAAEDLRHAA
jgi:hypothetical protein